MTKRGLFWYLYQPYKWLVFAPVVVVITLALAGLTLVLRPVLGARAVSGLTGVSWARMISWLTPMTVSVEGREHVVPGQSYVLACNHQSHYDVLVLYGWLGIDFKWVMKQELRRIPGLGAACASLGHIFIDRSDHQAALRSLDEAKRRVVDGTSVMFFPEGTRSPDGRLLGFKRGAFRMAMDLGLPILPLTINGTRKVLPARSVDLLPGTARLAIHPPIPTEGLRAEDLSRLLEETKAVIATSLGD